MPNILKVVQSFGNRWAILSQILVAHETRRANSRLDRYYEEKVLPLFGQKRSVEIEKIIEDIVREDMKMIDFYFGEANKNLNVVRKRFEERTNGFRHKSNTTSHT